MIKNNDRENIIKDYSIDVIIPTYHTDDKFNQLLFMLYRQTVKPKRVIILHTVETEGQEQKLPKIPDTNITVIPIDKKDFDHGGTRRYGAELSDADILLYMTQDAIPVDEYLIENLIKPYEDPRVAATYARQLPEEKADLLERYSRLFNYPKDSKVKSSEDIHDLGIKTFFCSNVCASYRKETYQKLGGFVKNTIFNEDMILAFAIIGAGYKIAYTADAKVIHSHRYSCLQQFTRNFDLGVSHRQYIELFQSVKSETEGIKLVKQSLQYLIDHKQYLLIPDLILTAGCKYLGYKLGFHYNKLPRDLVVRFSMNKSYWN
ncbi:glycosyltransferase family 2 protein [Mobilitalea sibirica]|uniref:Glycosyltransferase family 2 protein n=1 Tax=Mobilitalea sibirica TaxID=1462919 RepID=A0A8J7KZN3_9FIRM|nr:glycosyltransferase family 2 protein [Mobilitalea sibirica]MBH1940578.1 glycosyltransferase family 2 protein [Mobilitalea sibirica]